MMESLESGISEGGGWIARGTKELDGADVVAIRGASNEAQYKRDGSKARARRCPIVDVPVEDGHDGAMESPASPPQTRHTRSIIFKFVANLNDYFQRKNGDECSITPATFLTWNHNKVMIDSVRLAIGGAR
jgi:transposase-like protein